ncbi:MAG: LysR family transcriptional regulator [Candidatus Faecousia sp.]|nr:LysR family transcriptional regulator [Candidatus Faecousia sp.]
MDKKDFELLQALADSRNITKAADKLYITQSALSSRHRAGARGRAAAAVPSGYPVHPLRGGGSGPLSGGGPGNGTDAQKAGVWIPSLSAWRW